MAPRVNEIFDCEFCDKSYTVKNSLISHLKKKHEAKIDENKKINKKKGALIASSIIMEEVVEKAMLHDSPKVPIDPSNDWLSTTNSDLAEMLEIAEAAMSLDSDQTPPQIIDIEDEDENSQEGSLDKCNICDENVKGADGLNEHVKTKHVEVNEANIDNCKECIKYKQVDMFKDKALENKQECIKKLGTSLNKMAHEKRAIVGENKSLRK